MVSGVENREEWFRDCFKEITGYDPFPWQERLFLFLSQEEIPPSIDIPTGCGKTKLMVVWLLALVHQAKNGSTLLPRRLVWIVNRRAIVDQATEEAERIAKKTGEIPEISEVLKNLSLIGGKDGEPIVVSTLRGELADNEKWKMDPSRPSIIVGTVDMIGSKLLFRGYGDGRSYRPYHAGLLGVDTLIVLDEAQLVPAFDRLLSQLEKLRKKYSGLKPFHVIRLSATLRKNRGFTLTEKDLEHPTLKERINAEKILKLHPTKAVPQEIVNLATRFEGEGVKVAVFVRSPEDATKISELVKRKIGDSERALLLTGEIRGFERDKLVKENEIFKKFKFDSSGPPRLEKTLYLISTSAGEVGIDIDATHCICDLVPIDSLIQRWGRINRGGFWKKSEIHLVYPENLKPEKEEGRKKKLVECELKTLEFLKSIPNVSPKSLKAQPPLEAFSPEPFSPELTHRELDRWSLTSFDMREIDPNYEFRIEFWLHGQEEEQEVYLVWREDIEYLLEAEKTKEVFDFYPVIAKEKLRIPLEKAKEFLKEEEVSRSSILVDARGEVHKVHEKLNQEGEESLNRLLPFGTVFFSTKVGGLTKEGYLKKSQKERAMDVADFVDENTRVRGRLYAERVEGHWEARPLGTEGLAEWCESKRIECWTKKIDKLHFEDFKKLQEYLEEKWKLEKVILKKDENEEPIKCLFYLKTRPEPTFPTREVLLQPHEEKVAQVVEKICEKLELEPLLPILREAALLHDEGKRNEVWQEKVMRNRDPNVILAKGKGSNLTIKYRHEFGSLLLSKRKLDEKKSEPDEELFNEMLLHLVASTHGWARPTFPEETLENAGGEYRGIGRIGGDKIKEILKDSPIRFDKLQKELGYWNLAFVESILKAADWLVSGEEI